MREEPAASLFVYGTLLCPEIQEMVIGRVPASSPAILKGYGCYFVRDATFPGIIRHEGGKVEGRVLSELTPEELQRLDAYEDDFYDRLEVEVVCQEKRHLTMAYVVPGECESLLTSREWTREVFESEYLNDYLKRLVVHAR